MRRPPHVGPASSGRWADDVRSPRCRADHRRRRRAIRPRAGAGGIVAVAVHLPFGGEHHQGPSLAGASTASSRAPVSPVPGEVDRDLSGRSRIQPSTSAEDLGGDRLRRRAPTWVPVTAESGRAVEHADVVGASDGRDRRAERARCPRPAPGRRRTSRVAPRRPTLPRPVHLPAAHAADAPRSAEPMGALDGRAREDDDRAGRPRLPASRGRLGQVVLGEAGLGA